MTAAEPKRSRTSSSAASSALPLERWKGSVSWTAAVVVEVAHGQPDEGEALALDHRPGLGEEVLRRGQDGLGVGGGLGQRVRAGRPGEVVEAEPEHHGAPHPVGGPHAPGHPVDQGGQDGDDLLGRAAPPAERTLRADRAAAAADHDRAGIPVVGERVDVPARRPDRGWRRATDSGRRATSPTVVIARSPSLAAVTGPTPHSRPTGSGWRKASSSSGSHDQEAVRLGDRAGHLGQELRRAPRRR